MMEEGKDGGKEERKEPAESSLAFTRNFLQVVKW